MPFPSQTFAAAVRRDPPRTPGWSQRLLMFASTMLFVSVALYLGLLFGYQPYLEGQVRELDREIKKFSQEIPLETQTQTVNFYAQLANIKKLLGTHTAATPLLSFLEARTLPTVRYTRLTADVAAGKVNLNGEAKSMQDIGDQANVFEADDAVKQVAVNKTGVDAAGVWTFDITLTASPSFFAAAANGSSPSSAPTSSTP